MNRWFRTIVFLVLLAGLSFGSMTRIPLTDPDETFYARTTVEMLDHGSYVTPLLFDRPQFEKPPLFYWLLMVPFEILGARSGAARLVPRLFGFLGVAATFFFCRRVIDERVAWTAAVLLSTSLLYAGMSMLVLTDIVLSVLLMTASYCFYLWSVEARDRYLYALAALAGLAVLTKGPVAIVILLASGVVFLVLARERARLRPFLAHPWVLVFAGICLPWYTVVIATHGRDFIREFIIHDNLDRIRHAEHANLDHFWFYPLVIAVGLFPWTFFMATMGRGWRRSGRLRLYLVVWCAVTFTVFEAAHSKLASYILPLVPAVVILLAMSIASLDLRARPAPGLAAAHALLGVVFLVGPWLLPRAASGFVAPLAVAGARLFGMAVIVGAVLLLRGRLLPAIAAQACGFVALVLFAGLAIPARADRLIANDFIKDVVSREHYEGRTILVDKRDLRGVYFYSGNPVVVMDHNHQPFWSPHPVEVIGRGDELARFFDARDRVLCVLDEPYADEIRDMFKGQRNTRILFEDGHKVVFMSEEVRRSPPGPGPYLG